ncbi:hypothetical protein HMPREF1981_01299 [Bacteroides pyogenes F0041]|uniref:Uncharacterized protein n=1 Tax=Bacteroides pyogenes F0041 TaxID=1321819 RepID=U2E0S2_9BACE|nr:hypothetical protein HMPREF1981_01299 [Bacteroides pyogenes F0041]GAE23040.1 hypothetical protein JCM10003_2732 [Bacteroides pyogenes JCM 10003]
MATVVAIYTQHGGHIYSADGLYIFSESGLYLRETGYFKQLRITEPHFAAEK